jgi:hypothetical protein
VMILAPVQPAFAAFGDGSALGQEAGVRSLAGAA